jgi:hypothetical protein
LDRLGMNAKQHHKVPGQGCLGRAALRRPPIRRSIRAHKVVFSQVESPDGRKERNIKNLDSRFA